MSFPLLISVAGVVTTLPQFSVLPVQTVVFVLLSLATWVVFFARFTSISPSILGWIRVALVVCWVLFMARHVTPEYHRRGYYHLPSPPEPDDLPPPAESNGDITEVIDQLAVFLPRIFPGLLAFFVQLLVCVVHLPRSLTHPERVNDAPN